MPLDDGTTPRPGVALIVVSHDGAGWLPTVIDGIMAQTAPIARVRAVDTGSKDESADLLREAFGEVEVIGRGASFPEAVAAAAAGVTEEWLWILHDDSTPDPGALAALLAAAERTKAAAVGPKLREWPSLRRLIEIGITMSGTGRRETGLERAEYDHGQHDAERTVLAVNTAGLLVRREVFEEVHGFEPLLPIFGNDLDFGWRVAAAGHRTVIAPSAIVFHVAAAHNGVRQTPLTGRHTHYQERKAALFTLLANSSRLGLPLRMIRLVFGTLLRVLGFITVRQVGVALDELAALLHVYTHLGDLREARKRRTPVGGRRLGLLAPWWLPYRHGLDFVSDVIGALTDQAADVAERRRIAAAEADPASFAAREQALRQADEDGEIPSESGWLVRFLGNPVAVTLAVVVVLGLIAARAAYGPAGGGGLWAAPGGASDWWRFYLESKHPVGLGTSVPAPPYVLPLALLATVLGGSASFAITVIMVGAFPVALWGAWRLLRVVGRLISHRGAPRWLILWAATSYALLPYVSGAWGAGRLAFVVSAAILPWLAHAALGFSEPEPERRWVSGWRVGLLLALIVSFSPVAWLVALVATGCVVGATYLLLRGPLQGVSITRAVWGPPALALGIPVVLLFPWWFTALIHGAGAGLFLEAGAVPAPTLDGLHLLLGHLAHAGLQGGWGLVLPILAVLALVPTRTRIPVIVCWAFAGAAALAAALLAQLPVWLPAGTTTPSLALPLLIVQGSLLVAVSLGAQGVLAEGLHLTDGRLRRWVAGGLVAAAVIPVLVGLGWSTLRAGHGLSGEPSDGVPDYMLGGLGQTTAQGVLVLRGQIATGVSYAIIRRGGLTEGQQAVLATQGENDDLTADVRTLVSNPDSATVAGLSQRGVRYIVQPPPADPVVTATIDSVGGLTRASAANPATRAWQIPVEATVPSLEGSISWLRGVLLLLQAISQFAVIVMSLPRQWGAGRA